MAEEQDHAAMARAIVDDNLYMVLGTADPDGRPWVSPVYYAPRGYHEFFWVSKPEAMHSRNLETRDRISIVIFDSRVEIGTGRGFYMSAAAREVTGDDRAAAIEVFSRRSLEHGGEEFTVADVEPPARLRLYRAVAEEQYVLDANDRRIPVAL